MEEDGPSSSPSVKFSTPSCEASSGEVSKLIHGTMENLHTEVEKAETKMQKEMAAVWQKMLETLERRKKEYSSQYDDEIRVLKDQVNTILEQKSAVEAQRVDLMAELETSKKKQHQLEEQLQSTKTQLICSRDDLKELKVRFAASEKKYSSEVDLYQTKLKEQSDILKEYQDKVITVTGKVQKLSQQIAAEKNSTEKVKKSYSSQISHQSAEAKKMALELSKLKVLHNYCS